MSDRQKRNREMGLVDQADRGNGLAPFLEHPDVQAFFNAYELARFDEIAGSHPNDDDTRRAAALQLHAMRELRKEMNGIVARGRRAAEKLEGLDHG